jgi:hypothetical protein
VFRHSRYHHARDFRTAPLTVMQPHCRRSRSPYGVDPAMALVRIFASTFYARHIR